MSFNLPYHGLSQELRDIIYRHALCPLQGITVQVNGYGGSLWDEPADWKFKCIQPVVAGLLRTERQTHRVTLPILYSGNVFSLDMTCLDAFQFLQSLPEHGRLQMKSLSLPSGLMAADDSGNRSHAEELCKFLIGDMRLRDITLAVPNDMQAGTGGRDEGCYEWFMWTLHEGLIKAFKGGQFREIRFAHPRIYAEDVSVYGFHNVENYIEDTLLEEYQKPLHERRRLYWERFWDARFDGTVCGDTLEAVHEFAHDIWQRAGYTIERDSSRPGEKGTVLVIRRMAASLKRRCEEQSEEERERKIKGKGGRCNEGRRKKLKKKKRVEKD